MRAASSSLKTAVAVAGIADSPRSLSTPTAPARPAHSTHCLRTGGISSPERVLKVLVHVHRQEER